MAIVKITPGPVKINTFEPISGGTTGQVLTKTDDGYDWKSGIPTGEIGQTMVYTTAGASWDWRPTMKSMSTDYEITIGDSDEIGKFSFGYYSGSALLGQKIDFIVPVENLKNGYRSGCTIAYAKVTISMGILKKSDGVYTVTFNYIYNTNDSIYYLGSTAPTFLGYKCLL